MFKFIQSFWPSQIDKIKHWASLWLIKFLWWTLNINPKNRVRPRRMLMNACLLIYSVLFSEVHQYNSLFKRPDLLLLQPIDHYPWVLWVIFNLQILIPRNQQIVNRFIIDFQIRNPHFIVVVWIFLDRAEDVPHSTRKNTWSFRRSQHSIGLSRCCLSVHENSSIIALQCRPCNRSCDHMVDLRSWNFTAKDIV